VHQGPFGPPSCFARRKSHTGEGAMTVAGMGVTCNSSNTAPQGVREKGWFKREKLVFMRARGLWGQYEQPEQRQRFVRKFHDRVQWSNLGKNIEESNGTNLGNPTRKLKKIRRTGAGVWWSEEWSSGSTNEKGGNGQDLNEN